MAPFRLAHEAAGIRPACGLPVTVPARLDHLVLATPRLEETVRRLETAWGVPFLPGGTHPAWGTRNAILPLAGGCYLEIIGPDKALAGEPPKIFRIAWLAAPRLATWAARGTDLPALVARAAAAGIALGRVSPGSRQRPDGTRLTWWLTDPLQPRDEGLLPFFIDWGGSPHPAAAAPAAVSLADFHAEHPDPAALAARLRVLDLDLRIERGPEARLYAAFMTPRGLLELPGILPGEAREV
jgi:Glyoxalase-like domain